MLVHQPNKQQLTDFCQAWHAHANPDVPRDELMVKAMQALRKDSNTMTNFIVDYSAFQHNLMKRIEGLSKQEALAAVAEMATKFEGSCDLRVTGWLRKSTTLRSLGPF